MNAVVLAGGKMSPDDPLYSEGQDGSRSLIKIIGKPMAQWVIDALDGAESVNEIFVIGLPAESGLSARKPLHFLPDQNGIFENVRYGISQATHDYTSTTKVITASSDIPAIRPEMVDWLASVVEDDPTQMLYYNVIDRDTMETKFPNSNRSYVRFSDIAVCGGDLNVIDKSFFSAEVPVWHQLTEARKNPIKQAGLLGFDTLLLVVFRLVSLEGAVNKICKRLSIKAKALLCPYAEIGMDADKPYQLAILRQFLENKA